MKRNVWMISSSFYPHIGGGERQALRLSQKLIERGWKVRVLTRRHNRRYPYLPPAVEEYERVPVHRISSRGWGKVGAVGFIVSGLLHLGRHGRHGIYHAHGIGAPGMMAVLAARLFGGRSLVKLRTGADVYTQARAASYDRGLGFLLRYADVHIAVNREVKEQLHSEGVAGERVRLLPNGVDPKAFSPCKDTDVARVQLFGEEGWWCGKSLFLFVGRLSEAKGVDVLLAAWAELPTKIRDECVLLIVGDGQEKPSLIAQCEEQGIASTVRFLGRREDVRRFYDAADVVVLPSRREGLSNVMLEAMACGLPVVCTAVGGAVDWVEASVNGKLVPPEDPAALASALVWMAANRDQWARLGAAARETVSESLSMDALVEKVERVYLAESQSSSGAK